MPDFNSDCQIEGCTREAVDSGGLCIGHKHLFMNPPVKPQAINGPCTGEGQSFEETGAAARARYMKGQIARYVVGFMFDFAFERVALIRKQKPAWQAGKLNGIGGKIEPGETREEAMRREFIEEAGVDLDWHFYCNCAGTNNDGSLFSLDCFWSQGPVQDLKSQEAEQIEILTLTQVIVRRREMIGNLPWHLELARELPFLNLRKEQTNERSNSRSSH